MSGFINKPVYISAHDPDDQFIFRSALQEINAELVTEIFFTGMLLLERLRSVCSDAGTNMPIAIVGDLHPPFFTAAHVQRIRQIEAASHLPLCVFVEKHGNICCESLLDAGATVVHHKPTGIRQLSLLFSDLIGTRLGS